MKLVEVVAECGYLDTLSSLAEQHGVLDYWPGSATGERCSIRMLVADDNRQALLDALQNLLAGGEMARIVVLPVEAALPRPAGLEAGDGKARKSTSATREELYSQIEKGARLDANFLILVFLSTVVAAIGLLEDNIAVLVGAMVIAPLLGPNLALSFATTLGDRDLLRQSFKTNLAGVSFTLLLSIGIGLLFPAERPGAEIVARTDIGLDGVLLALASGAAAVLSLTTGVASALVGVMVAVALLPPTATFGMLLATRQFELAMGAALLLAVNIVSVNVAANLVFLIKGVRPRTWIEKRKARQSVVWLGLFWIVSLAVLVGAVYMRQFVA